MSDGESGNSSIWPLKIIIPGKPVAKGRPRFGKGKVYTPKKTADFENTVAWMAKAAMGSRKPLEGPVKIHITASFKSNKKTWHVNRPDADNIEKGILDGLNGIAFLDDSQVCCKTFHKINDLVECVAVIVEPMPLVYEVTLEK